MYIEKINIMNTSYEAIIDPRGSIHFGALLQQLPRGKASFNKLVPGFAQFSIDPQALLLSPGHIFVTHQLCASTNLDSWWSKSIRK